MTRMYRGMALGRKSLKSANLDTCVDESDILEEPELDALVNIYTKQSLCGEREILVEIRTKTRTAHQKWSAAFVRC